MDLDCLNSEDIALLQSKQSKHPLKAYLESWQNAEEMGHIISSQCCEDRSVCLKEEGRWEPKLVFESPIHHGQSNYSDFFGLWASWEAGKSVCFQVWVSHFSTHWNTSVLSGLLFHHSLFLSFVQWIIRSHFYLPGFPYYIQLDIIFIPLQALLEWAHT